MKPYLKEEILVSSYNFDIWAFWSLRILEFPINTLNILYLGYIFKIFLKNLKCIFTYSFWGWEEMTHLNFLLSSKLHSIIFPETFLEVAQFLSEQVNLF